MIEMLRYRWRRDRLPILLFLLTFFVMSYPFVPRMHDHLPINSVDTHQALWQNWWVLEALTKGYDINDVHLLFYPTGLDHTLQPPRWTGLVFWAPLYLLFGDPFAFNMTAAIGIFLRAYGMYLFGMMLFERRLTAWVVGAFYAFAASNLTHALQQPFTGASEWIPWFMLAFVYGLSRIRAERNTRSIALTMVTAAALFSLNVYANLKIAIFAMLLGGGFVLLYMLVHQLWKHRQFWLAMLIFGVAAIVISLPVLYPMLRSDDLLAATSDPVVGGIWGGMDLLTYVKGDHFRPLNYMQSIANLSGDHLQRTNVTQGLSHVGIVSIVFASMGVGYALKVRCTVFIWVVLALFFFLLSLGLEIYVNRSLLDIYWTPYRIFQDNIIFRTLKWPFRMGLVFLFPFSVLIGYALHYRLRSLVLTRQNKLLLVISIIMLFYGTSIFPLSTRPAPRPEYLAKLAELAEGAVIDVPFGRHSAKYYMSVQRFHQRPMAEGMIARVPPGTYDYINENLLLATLQNPDEVVYDDMQLEDWQGAVSELLGDGFRFVILHKQVPVSLSLTTRIKGWALQLFWEDPKIYEDDDVIIYDLVNVDLENLSEFLADFGSISPAYSAALMALQQL